ncbi:MAG: hypothetical protein KF908_05385 [Nitrosomonas sp.]|nr:hypothetical protein [Nitrosomonas sp.]
MTVSMDTISAVKEASGMTVTDAIDLVDLMIEHDLCSDETPEHIKADLRVLAQIVRCVQAIYPFTNSEFDENLDRQLNAKDLVETMRKFLTVISNDISKGKYHATRTEQVGA